MSDTTYRPPRPITVTYVGDKRWRDPESARYYGEQVEVSIDKFNNFILSETELMDLIKKGVDYFKAQVGDREEIVELPDNLPNLMREVMEWRKRGWPEAHYDEDNDCPCPDHVAMRNA